MIEMQSCWSFPINAKFNDHFIGKYSMIRIQEKYNTYTLVNKVTTRWEGPQSLSYHKQ